MRVVDETPTPEGERPVRREHEVPIRGGDVDGAGARPLTRDRGLHPERGPRSEQVDEDLGDLQRSMEDDGDRNGKVRGEPGEDRFQCLETARRGRDHYEVERVVGPTGHDGARPSVTAFHLDVHDPATTAGAAGGSQGEM